MRPRVSDLPPCEISQEMTRHALDASHTSRAALIAPARTHVQIVITILFYNTLLMLFILTYLEPDDGACTRCMLGRRGR
jgi:hypothetical protein